MPIQSMYDIGEVLSYLDGYNIKRGEVSAIKLEVRELYRDAQYYINGKWVQEDHCHLDSKLLLNLILRYNPIKP